jgi:hypothetical protein
MLPYLFAALGGYLIGDSINKQYADGGLIVRSRIASIIGIDKALKYLDKDYVVSPFSLIESAVRKGFITIDEINKNLWDEAVIEAEDIEESYRDSGHGIGSSDMNAFISRMLNAAGIKVDVIDNKYTRLADGGETIGGAVSNKVLAILSEMKLASKEANEEKFDKLSNQIHEISDKEGLTEKEYEAWDEIRNKENERRIQIFVQR